MLNLRIRERAIEGGERQQPFITRGRLTVDLGPELGKRWQATGGRGEGIRVLDEKTIEITDPTAAYIAVPFGGNEQFDIGLTFEDTGKPTQTTNKTAAYEIEIVQEDAEKGELQGGVLYQIEALPVQ